MKVLLPVPAGDQAKSLVVPPMANVIHNNQSVRIRVHLDETFDCIVQSVLRVHQRNVIHLHFDTVTVLHREGEFFNIAIVPASLSTE